MSEYNETGSGGAGASGAANVYCSPQSGQGILTAPVLATIAMLQACPHFVASNANIYIQAKAAQGPTGLVRPYALVFCPDIQTDIKTGAYNHGTIEIWFEADVDPANRPNWNAAMLDFMGWVEAVWQEFIEQSLGEGALCVRQSALSVKPQRANWHEQVDPVTGVQQDYIQCMFEVPFGLTP
jgi:hypothetical protein